MTRRRAGRWRLALLIPAGLCLLIGLNSALLLLDVPAPVPAAQWAPAHGMIMVYGFVGSVIALERAVALGRAWGYLAPALLVAGAASQLLAVPLHVSGTLILAGMLVLWGVYVPLWRRQRAEAVIIQMLGACAGTVGALLWTGGVSVGLLLPWLAAFMVCTIAGERVELARVQLGRRAESWAVLLNFALVSGALAATLFVRAGTVLFAAALGALVLWLAVNDVARRTIRAVGAPRFMAACLLAGYFWLLVAAAIWALGYPDSTARYDAVVHAVFLGFVISMIMAHAPTILPAVLAIRLPYRGAMWLPALLLHAGLVVRLWWGDGLSLDWARKTGGVLNVVALLLFVIVAAGSAAAASRGRVLRKVNAQ